MNIVTDREPIEQTQAKLDQFAAAALIGLLHPDGWEDHDVARRAFDIAAAMLRERDLRHPEGVVMVAQQPVTETLEGQEVIAE